MNSFDSRTRKIRLSKSKSKPKTKRRVLKPAAKSKRGGRTDAILPMQDPYMMQIVKGEKTYEFRRYQLPSSVQRIWFYRTAPHSCLEYVCEIDPGVTRGHEGDLPLPEDGTGNREFNEWDKEWDGYDWAYRIRSVWQIRNAVTLADMRRHFGFESAPRSLVYLPESLDKNIAWAEQLKLR